MVLPTLTKEMEEQVRKWRIKKCGWDSDEMVVKKFGIIMEEMERAKGEA